MIVNFKIAAMLLHHQFVHIAKKYGKKIAIIDKTRRKKVSYAKSLIASLMLSSKFEKYDKGFIGIMIPTSAGAALTVLGALMSGRIPVMINYSTGAQQNAEYAQKKCGFKTIITSKALLEKIECPVIDGMVLIEDVMETIGVFDKIKAAIKSKMSVKSILKGIAGGSEDDTSVILFTSGSEKDPKAVQLTHRNISSNIESFSGYFGLNNEDICLSNLVFYHVFGLTINLWTPLYLGMTMVTYANPLDFKNICNIVRDEKPTLMAGTPSFFSGYLQKSEPGDFKSVRILIAGADKCPEALRKGYKEKHGVTLLEGYGATETSPVISANSLEHNRPGSIGRVISGVEVRIEHLETGAPCATREVGKIMVKGDLVMKGYYNDEQLTAEAINDGWYNTGDMGFFDEDNYLWHAGRFKRFVKIGGEMVSLVKVENVMEQYLPDGLKCCIVDVPDSFKGSTIVAVVTQEVDKKQLLKQMEGELLNIALPRKFIVMEDLPMMSTGKIDFRTVTRLVGEQLGINKD